jgi:hypothetical protein
VDRVYLTLSVPNLVVGGQVVNFLTDHERNPIPSPALLERRGQAFRRAERSFAEANDIPVLSFAGKREKTRPGVLADSPWPERKIDRVMPLMRKAAAAGRSQVVEIGVAQEFQRVFTGTKDQTASGAVWFSYNRSERRGDVLLLLPLGRGLRAGVHQDLRVLSLSGQDLGQRARVGQAPGPPGRPAVHRAVQRIRLLRRPSRLAGDPGPGRTRAHPGLRRALAGTPAIALRPR